MKIPKIIHQIWSDIEQPLPEYFAALGETWKRDYPDWKYIMWNDEMMNDFIVEQYPQYVEKYKSFPYNIQRWDAIRYLILDKMGGMYVDCDYESIEAIDKLVSDKTCCFSIEPSSHQEVCKRPGDELFNNAMMLCEPGNFFMRQIVEAVFERDLDNLPEHKFPQVMMTTGPWRLMDLYYKLSPSERNAIYLIPAKYVTPFDYNQAQRFRLGDMSDELGNCLNEAYAVHYFFSDWFVGR